MKQVNPHSHLPALDVSSVGNVSPPTALNIVDLPCMQTWIATSPPTRFYGSKKRLLPWIYDQVKSLEFETVLDPFGGTASVSRLFQGMGKEVTYGDAFLFNRQAAHAVLQGCPSFDASDFHKWIDGVTPVRGWVSEHFHEVFYTADENRWIDGFTSRLRRSGFNKAEKHVMQYCFYQASLRKRPFNLFHRANLGLRTKEGIKRSFGNLTTWNKSFDQHMKEAFFDLQACPRENVVSANIIDNPEPLEADGVYDLVYLDPPYLNRKTTSPGDDYWKKYAFLELVAQNLDSYPSALNQNRVPTIERPQPFLRWSTGHQYLESLETILDKYSASKVILSYTSESYPSVDQITALFRDRWSKTSVNYKTFSHALRKTKKSEVLFIGAHE